MKFATHQPTFMPWPGLVHKALSVDKLVLLDMVQYPRGFSWVNRNRLKSMHGTVWLTVPVVKKGLGLQRIDQVKVLEDPRWRKKHLMTFQHCYKSAPFFEEQYAFLSRLYSRAPEQLLDWNLALIDHIFRVFGVEKGYILQSELKITAKGTELIAQIGKAIGADELVVPRAGKGQIDVELLKKHEIKVTWLDYQYPVYPQLWGQFIKDLSSIDLLFNYGPYSRRILEKAQKKTVR